MTFQIVNSKKKFARISEHDVMTEHGLKVLTESVAQNKHLLPQKQQEKWEVALDLLNSLPSSNHYVNLRQNDAPNQSHLKKNELDVVAYQRNTLCKSVVLINSFVIDSQENDPRFEDVSKWGQQTACDLTPYISMITKWIEEYDLNISFYDFVLKSAKKNAQDFSKGEYTFKDDKFFKKYTEGESFAVFVSNGFEVGYVDGKGGFGPLARARLFESATAAQSLIKSSSYCYGGNLVCVKTSFMHLDPSNTSPVLSELKDAIQTASAEQQNKRLQQAVENDTLSNATREQLLQQLALLDQKSRSVGRKRKL